QRPPDFQTPVRLAQRYRFLDHLAPRAQIFEGHGAWIAVGEHRLDAFPSTPPILPRARRLARPLVGVAITPERLAERARRVDGQFFGAFGRKVLRRGHGRRGGLAALHSLPAPIPFLRDRPCFRPVPTTRHGVESER